MSPEEVTLAKAWPDELKLKKLDDDLLGDEDDYDDEDYYDEDYDEDEEDDELYDDEEYYEDDYKEDDKVRWKSSSATAMKNKTNAKFLEAEKNLD